MISRLFLLGLLLASMPVLLPSQTKKDVPVYPNAALDTAHEPGADAACCSFITTDPLNKVIAFYEAALQTKALDITALGTKYPVLKPQLQKMKQQLPPQVKLLAFVLRETSSNAGPVPELVEILSGQGRTNINLSDEDLGLTGARYGYEFRKATGTMERVDQEYSDWCASHPAAKQDQFEFPIYPGSLIDRITAGDKTDIDNTNFTLKGEKCYDVDLLILDTLAFEKVTAFYKDKLKGQFIIVPTGDVSGTEFEMDNKQFFWKDAGNGTDEFHGKRGDVNRILTVSLAQTIVPQYPYFDREQKTRVAGVRLPCIAIRLSSVMLGTCEEFPRETRKPHFSGGE